MDKENTIQISYNTSPSKILEEIVSILEMGSSLEKVLRVDELNKLNNAILKYNKNPDPKKTIELFEDMVTRLNNMTIRVNECKEIYKGFIDFLEKPEEQPPI